MFRNENSYLLSVVRMDHSHPHTYRLYKGIVNRNMIKNPSFNIDPSLKNLIIRITLINDFRSEMSIKLDISDELDDNSNHVFRLSTCLTYWIPYCIEILRRKKKSFSLCLNASDYGDDNYLSMDSANYYNLIPDEYSMVESSKSQYGSVHMDYSEFIDNWLSRRNIMFWRGSTTGVEKITSLRNLQELERVKVCLNLRSCKGFDLRISNIVQYDMPKQIITQWLRKNRIIGRRVKESVFGKYMYYPDIPGNNLSCGSWGTIKKYLRGNLVFRPNHARNFYYDKFMTPWENYIPINNDFSNLYDQYMWAENNPCEAALIAWRSHSIARHFIDNIREHFIQAVTPKLNYINH